MLFYAIISLFLTSITNNFWYFDRKFGNSNFDFCNLLNSNTNNKISYFMVLCICRYDFMIIFCDAEKKEKTLIKLKYYCEFGNVSLKWNKMVLPLFLMKFTKLKPFSSMTFRNVWLKVVFMFGTKITKRTFEFCIDTTFKAFMTRSCIFSCVNAITFSTRIYFR